MLSSYDMIREVGRFSTSLNKLLLSKRDHHSQEDALRIRGTILDSDNLLLNCDKPSDFSRQSNAVFEFSFYAKSFESENCLVKIGMCDSKSCKNLYPITIKNGNWKKNRISLSCFENIGIDMKDIVTPFEIFEDKGFDMGSSNIRLEKNKDVKPGWSGL